MRNGPYSKDGVAGALFVRLVADLDPDDDVLFASDSALKADKKRRGGV